MKQSCPPSFDEALLSGYVDGELTQGDNQRVRVHLENCPTCQSMVSEIRQIREAATTTHFRLLSDEEWRETPRSAGSRWLRKAGWVLLIAWILGAGWLAIEGIVAGSTSWYEKALVGTLIGGGLLLFLSVLFDRLKALKTDRYGSVEK